MRGESLSSLLTGIASLTMGLGATIVILSCYFGKPYGAEDLFESQIVVEQVRLPGGTGTGVARKVTSRLMPSWQLISMLLVGGCLGGLGIALSRRQIPPRRAVVSGIGLAVCVVGSLLGWFLIMLVAWQEGG
jgi:hypothetical protein